MATEQDFIRIKIGRAAYAFCYRQAEAAAIGGRSNFRTGGDRKANLLRDQLIGQLGAYAGHRYLFGHGHLYAISRWYQNRNPCQGDGGYDIPGANVDFKASRVGARPLIDYSLHVRPRERRRGWIYILVGVDVQEDGAEAILAGWAREEELPREPDPDGVFVGAYSMPVRDLHPLPPFRWEL